MAKSTELLHLIGKDVDEFESKFDKFRNFIREVAIRAGDITQDDIVKSGTGDFAKLREYYLPNFHDFDITFFYQGDLERITIQHNKKLVLEIEYNNHSSAEAHYSPGYWENALYDLMREKSKTIDSYMQTKLSRNETDRKILNNGHEQAARRKDLYRWAKKSS